MKFKIGEITFFPFEIVRKPFDRLILLLLVIFLSNVFTMWGELFSGRSPMVLMKIFKL